MRNVCRKVLLSSFVILDLSYVINDDEIQCLARKILVVLISGLSDDLDLIYLSAYAVVYADNINSVLTA